RGQPERERARVVLDQDGDKPFEAAEDCTVNDDRPVLGVVGADVLQVEVLRLLIIELNRRAVLVSPDRIRDAESDLRSVEPSVAFVQCVVEMSARERLLQLRLGVIPGGNLAHELFRARRQLRRERQTEVTVHTLNETDEPLTLVAYPL